MAIGAKSKKTSKRASARSEVQALLKSVVIATSELEAFKKKHRRVFDQYAEMLDEVKLAQESLKAKYQDLAKKEEKSSFFIMEGVKVSATYYQRRVINAAFLTDVYPDLVTEWKGLYSVSVGEYDKAVAAGVINPDDLPDGTIDDIPSVRIDFGRADSE